MKSWLLSGWQWLIGLSDHKLLAISIVVAIGVFIASLFVPILRAWVMRICSWGWELAKQAARYRITDKDNIRCSETPTGLSVGDENSPKWEVHANAGFATEAVVMAVSDGTGWVFEVPIFIRNMGFQLSPAFKLELLVKTPYSIRRQLDANGLMRGRGAIKNFGNETYWQAIYTHMTPLGFDPKFIGKIEIAFHGPTKLPRNLEILWRVIRLADSTYYPANAFLYFCVVVETTK
ncbi:MAG: hypothetical protein ACYDA1_09775 [Vulcanimicrobiaceae bacterium]